MKKAMVLGSLLLAALSVRAETVSVELAIPQLDVAEYHRPYVAVWISNEEREIVEHIGIWVEQEKWWRDLRSWWRRGGAYTELPLDGVSGATRKPGVYTLNWQGDLPEGELTLNVEAVREVGGREHLRLPLPSDRNGQVEQTGDSELGRIAVTITQ
ncbi:DUF2271 domain-containing protein [Gilvimarinus algae]|uniref:DUF2271 domain-containing protein n=1 Tax=Gilvimarinus algae TaxID=3058037 RepID=A0ABT8TF11_9GAMM|nr:DUF2271 domain-containing protein [Gilvimarinus sp. SDUM040014]MDO3382225.1 DUF2271 domain-containing protein [Gilvimarinus sp. SDUM040014]